MTPAVRVLIEKAKDQPDHWVGIDHGTLRLDVRWQAPRLTLSLKALRTGEDAQTRLQARQAWTQLDLGKDWTFREEHSRLLFRWFAEKEIQDPSSDTVQGAGAAGVPADETG